MKTTITLISAALAVAIAAPVVNNENLPGPSRTKKSPPPYGSPILTSSIGSSSGYGSPCASAPAAPVSFYLTPQTAPNSYNHYRAEKEGSDFVDQLNEEFFEQAHARSVYGGYESPAYTNLAAPSVSSSVTGVFPKANAGGCAIPLLLSCSPRIISGQLLKQYQSGYAAPASSPLSYRAEHPHHDKMEMKHASLDHHHNAENWSNIERAMDVPHHPSDMEEHQDLHLANQLMDKSHLHSALPPHVHQ